LPESEESCRSVYGLGVSLRNACPSLDSQINCFLGHFSVAKLGADGLVTRGDVGPFDLAQVTRSLSPAGASARHCDNLAEIYSLAEKHWVVDDRWGMCEINLLKHRWRSWILPRPSLDNVRVTEAAVLWPMAQLLRPLGVDLAPVLAIERAGWGAVIVCPFGIEREIARLIRAGYRVIGQRWTALWRQNGRLVLGHVPGVMESTTRNLRSIGAKTAWIDLNQEHPRSTARIAGCEAVIIIEPGRRGKSHGRVLSPTEAQVLLRRAWPIVELPLDRPRVGNSAATLARQCVCLAAQLSGCDDEFLQLVDFARRRSSPRLEVKVHSALRRHFAIDDRRHRIGRVAG
jgi:hypothetical protein